MAGIDADLMKLEAHRDALYAKLDTGYDVIEALVSAANRDEDKLREYEQAWQNLKTEYDAVVEEIRRLM